MRVLFVLGYFRCTSLVNRLIVPHQKQLPERQDEDDVARRDLGHEGAADLTCQSWLARKLSQDETYCNPSVCVALQFQVLLL